MIRTALKHLSVLALATLAVSCATSGNLRSKEDLVIAANFKVIKPTKPDQKAILEKLPADKITRITYSGKTYYVLPDRADGQAYVGGPKQYQSYQQLSQAKEQALEYDKDVDHKPGKKSAVNWSGWDGWSAADGQTN
ncbi:MAG: hypothetical protein ABIS50_06675 [Luteolibacter sp.]|uniref:hypothetical protein n=1 Tax=Luteolibacter sp. TaxID=1962973 RepID=UPI003265B725